MGKFVRLCGVVAILLGSSAATADTDWVARSNEHAQIVLDVMASFNPEGAGRLGVDGLDEEILDLGPGVYERGLETSRGVLAELRKRHTAEREPKVRQDLAALRGFSEEMRR